MQTQTPNTNNNHSTENPEPCYEGISNLAKELFAMGKRSSESDQLVAMRKHYEPQIEKLTRIEQELVETKADLFAATQRNKELEAKGKHEHTQNEQLVSQQKHLEASRKEFEEKTRLQLELEYKERIANARNHEREQISREREKWIRENEQLTTTLKLRTADLETDRAALLALQKKQTEQKLKSTSIGTKQELDIMHTLHTHFGTWCSIEDTRRQNHEGDIHLVPFASNNNNGSNALLPVRIVIESKGRTRGVQPKEEKTFHENLGHREPDGAVLCSKAPLPGAPPDQNIRFHTYGGIPIAEVGLLDDPVMDTPNLIRGILSTMVQSTLRKTAMLKGSASGMTISCLPEEVRNFIENLIDTIHFLNQIIVPCRTPINSYNRKFKPMWAATLESAELAYKTYPGLLPLECLHKLNDHKPKRSHITTTKTANEQQQQQAAKGVDLNSFLPSSRTPSPPIASNAIVPPAAPAMKTRTIVVQRVPGITRSSLPRKTQPQRPTVQTELKFAADSMPALEPDTTTTTNDASSAPTPAMILLPEFQTKKRGKAKRKGEDDDGNATWESKKYKTAAATMTAEACEAAKQDQEEKLWREPTKFDSQK